MNKQRMRFLTRVKTYLLWLVFLSFLIPWAFPRTAESGKPASKKVDRIPAAILKWPEAGSDYTLLVDKSRQKVFLYHKGTPARPQKVFRCSTGEKDGQKSRKNDRRTPEGIYFFTKSYVERELSPIYGIRAFPIDYPNPVDAKEGRGGYGIWFHGTNKALQPKDSNGCIVLDNQNIDELAGYIKLHDTPVVISDRIEMAGPVTVREEARALEGIIEKWRQAWETKNIDEYMSLYGARFENKGKDRQAWKEHKARLAQKYKNIRVTVDNLRLLKSDGVVVATFTQRYSTSSFRSEGKKMLYLQQNSKEWKIIGEYFTGKEKTILAAEKTEIFPRKEIEQFILSWKRAWENKDIKGYISCYHPTFVSRGMNVTSWRKHRQRLNNKYSRLSIGLKDLKITRVSGHRARASFLQVYRADAYRDIGYKELHLARKDGHWKIKEEQWRPLKR
jgi:murein L,D-transpeptidase YafK